MPSLNRIFLISLLKLVYLESTFTLTSLNDLCVLKPFPSRKRDLTYDDIHYTLKYF